MIRWLCIVDIVGGVACIFTGVMLMQAEIDATSVVIAGMGAVGVVVGLTMIRAEDRT